MEQNNTSSVSRCLAFYTTLWVIPPILWKTAEKAAPLAAGTIRALGLLCLPAVMEIGLSHSWTWSFVRLTTAGLTNIAIGILDTAIQAEGQLQVACVLPSMIAYSCLSSYNRDCQPPIPPAQLPV